MNKQLNYLKLRAWIYMKYILLKKIMFIELNSQQLNSVFVYGQILNCTVI